MHGASEEDWYVERVFSMFSDFNDLQCNEMISTVCEGMNTKPAELRVLLCFHCDDRF